MPSKIKISPERLAILRDWFERGKSGYSARRELGIPANTVQRYFHMFRGEREVQQNRKGKLT